MNTLPCGHVSMAQPCSVQRNEREQGRTFA